MKYEDRPRPHAVDVSFLRLHLGIHTTLSWSSRRSTGPEMLWLYHNRITTDLPEVSIRHRILIDALSVSDSQGRCVRPQLFDPGWTSVAGSRLQTRNKTNRRSTLAVEQGEKAGSNGGDRLRQHLYGVTSSVCRVYYSEH